MCEPVCAERFEQRIANLEKLSSVWFKAHKHNTLSAMLVLYFKEAQSGSLKDYYDCILDDSVECLTRVLPQIANTLSTAIIRVPHVPPHNLRPALSLVVYWLIQAHTGKKNELPDRHEMLEIIDSILTNSVLSFYKL